MHASSNGVDVNSSLLLLGNGVVSATRHTGVGRKPKRVNHEKNIKLVDLTFALFPSSRKSSKHIFIHIFTGSPAKTVKSIEFKGRVIIGQLF